MRDPIIKPKGRRTKKSIDENCIYIIEVLDYKVRYSFSVSRNTERNPAPFSEYSEFQITGKFLLPPKLAGAAIECTVYADREYEQFVAKPEEFSNLDPRTVGRLVFKKNHSSFCGWVPISAASMFNNMLQADQFKFLELYGKTLYHGSAGITSIDLRNYFNPEDY